MGTPYTDERDARDREYATAAEKARILREEMEGVAERLERMAEDWRREQERVCEVAEPSAPFFRVSDAHDALLGIITNTLMLGNLHLDRAIRAARDLDRRAIAEWRQRHSEDDFSPYDIACREKDCGAPAGEACRTRNGGPRREPHDARGYTARELRRLLRDEK